MSPDALYAVHLEGAELLRKAKERENPFQVEMKPDVSRGSQAVRARMLRNRLMIKNDARKQKEFFEKKRVEKKMQDLGLPGAPQGQSGGSLDLLTLFIVNQIAAKKEQHSSIKHDTPKVAHANKAKRVQRSIKEGPINLPMSPCSPSRLCLGESQPHYGTQGTVLKSSNFRPQTQSYGHLSPVLESSFSDGSISDYQCHPADTLSPFSLTASDSSSGVFNLQHRPELKQRRDTVTASRGSQHIQNSSVTRVQFGSMESNYLGGRGLALQTSVGHRSFIHETGENLEQMLFLDFDDRAGHFESENFETNIKGKSSPYSAVFCDLKESQYTFSECDFWSQVPESTQSFEPSCWRHSSGTPSYSSKGDILSTDSNDEDQCQRKSESWRETYSSDTSTGLLSAVCLHGKTKGTAYDVLQVKKTTPNSRGDQQNPLCTGGIKRKREWRGELKTERTEGAENTVQSAGLSAHVLHDPAEGVNEASKDELGADGMTFTRSEEMVVLQKIANILLMLKEKSGSK
ncbi:uncharacterized protein redic1 isoform X2 [Scleropages formosus]|uniref:uncharacterized protein redic1 isoform X2 n=1 Tax=Scleropages formosus TaxID=113540 RepID=UPI0010FAB7DE|nr:uncharacterized protein C12orf40 homolog isoform X2 [Scleropages formosus]